MDEMRQEITGVKQVIAGMLDVQHQLVGVLQVLRLRIEALEAVGEVLTMLPMEGADAAER